MARKKSEEKMVQFNMTIPESWKEELESLARLYSVEEEKTITVQELLRRCIQEKYQLGVDVDEQCADFKVRTVGAEESE